MKTKEKPVLIVGGKSDTELIAKIAIDVLGGTELDNEPTKEKELIMIFEPLPIDSVTRTNLMIKAVKQKNYKRKNY